MKDDLTLIRDARVEPETLLEHRGCPQISTPLSYFTHKPEYGISDILNLNPSNPASEKGNQQRWTKTRSGSKSSEMKTIQD